MEKIISLLEKSLISTLKKYSEKIIKNVNWLDSIVRENNLQNEQWFLDWQDKLNAISVK